MCVKQTWPVRARTPWKRPGMSEQKYQISFCADSHRIIMTEDSRPERTTRAPYGQGGAHIYGRNRARRRHGRSSSTIRKRKEKGEAVSPELSRSRSEQSHVCMSGTGTV
ncbi:hypothetical protein AcW1_002266 [Taiwanofungus camphoratus]|nr:hypothetical protein AcW1_002266 [Antrodia cinnamomea]